jgi:hypothetical protein
LRAIPTVEGRGVVLVDAQRLDDVTIPPLVNRIRQALVARESGGVAVAVSGHIR